MDLSENGNRLKKIYRHLLEIAKGNLWHRIERSEKKDEMEALVALTNMVTEEFRDTVQHEGYINFHDSYLFTLQMLILLDNHFLVTDINDGARQLLGYEGNQIQNRPFEGLLASRSKEEWTHIKKDIVSLTWKEEPVTLDIRTKNGLLFPAYCHIVPISHSEPFRSITIITAFEMARTSKVIEKTVRERIRKSASLPKVPVRTKNVLRPYDIEIIRSIGEHLRKHLQDPTPSLGDLAFNFKINGFKLKYGFKKLYGMTIFQYLKEERLKKAHVLVEHTDFNFKEITSMVGFKSASHFSREFNARFGYRPRALRSAADES